MSRLVRHHTTLLGATAAGVLLLAAAACGGAIGEPLGAEGDIGEDTEEGSTASAISVSTGQNAEVTAHDGLNLRTGPSTSNRVLLTMPHGSTVSVKERSGSWFKVTYRGTSGFAYGAYLTGVSSGGGSSGGTSGGGTVSTGGAPVDQAIARARSGLGFSYHWGGGCWDPGSSAHGACYGSCPDCTHSGTWGADCSGYVGKIWQVPGAEAVTHCSHPYNTTSFYDTHPHWKDVRRSDARRGDAFVRHGHIFLYESGDAWGSMTAYEAKGCSYGIVRNSRTADSSYKVTRRNGY